jgi:hypothetical protein
MSVSPSNVLRFRSFSSQNRSNFELFGRAA